MDAVPVSVTVCPTPTVVALAARFNVGWVEVQSVLTCLVKIVPFGMVNVAVMVSDPAWELVAVGLYW